MRVVGIDPGGSGALFEVAYDPVSGWVPTDSLAMPMIDVGKRVRQVDVRGVVDWFAARPVPPALVVLENVGYMPGGGYASAILTARVERLIGMFETLRTIPYELVMPRKWQKALGVSVSHIKGEKAPARKKRIKAAVAAYVSRRFPTARLIPVGCRVVDDGLADALAIAYWGAMQLDRSRPPVSAV